MEAEDMGLVAGVTPISFCGTPLLCSERATIMVHLLHNRNG